MSTSYNTQTRTIYQSLRSHEINCKIAWLESGGKVKTMNIVAPVLFAFVLLSFFFHLHSFFSSLLNLFLSPFLSSSLSVSFLLAFMLSSSSFSLYSIYRSSLSTTFFPVSFLSSIFSFYFLFFLPCDDSRFVRVTSLSGLSRQETSSL